MADKQATPATGGGMPRLLSLVITGIHKAFYRLTSGRVGGRMGTMDILVLTTTGRKSGEPRSTPLAYFRDGANLVVVASANGAPTAPAWYLNLQSNPEVTVVVGKTTQQMRAATAAPADRARLWPLIVRQAPNFAGYQEKTSREIPVVILQRA
ncbi:MAG: nitroreductase family deazaflavin-dependent oxidoreductase [Chloroflexota bacterium]|nr:nitroreductase family deazaflavin-dependent oxidoreductase [Chloroflexota bacterium]